MKGIVFDLGGTLMTYTGMPYSWADHYRQGFEAVRESFSPDVSQETFEEALRILKSFNPRINYREVEYSPSFIFSQAFQNWKLEAPVEACIDVFWSGLQLKAEIYPDVLDCLARLKEGGYRIAALTDLPSALPDERFQRDIAELLPLFDCYVSSSIAGFRKPHFRGLTIISEQLGIPVPELIFVGDEEKDAQTALNAHCRFIRIARTQNLPGSIRNLSELSGLL